MYRVAGAPPSRVLAMALNLRGRQFRPRWGWLVVALVGTSAFVALGHWQLRRADERRAIAAAYQAALGAPAVALPAAAIEASTYALRRVVVRGTFVPTQTIYLDNRIRHGRVGYEVVTPLLLSCSTLHVAVLRGWIAGRGRRIDLPRLPTPAGQDSRGSRFCSNSAPTAETASCASGRSAGQARRRTKTTRCSGSRSPCCASFSGWCSPFDAMRLLPEDPVKRGRFQLLLLITVFLLPLVGSALAYLFGWSTGHTSNYGELIEPRAVPQSALATLTGGTLRLDMLQGKWVLLQFDAPTCDARCERKHYTMRQVRKALGRDESRVERVWILTGGGRHPGAATRGARVRGGIPGLARLARSRLPDRPARQPDAALSAGSGAVARDQGPAASAQVLGDRLKAANCSRGAPHRLFVVIDCARIFGRYQNAPVTVVTL
ncbi:MAG: SURF1 family protein [bacterium]